MKERSKTCYLAGKINGLLRFWVVFKFYLFDFILSMRGFHVWNPIRQIDKSIPDKEALKICLKNLPDQEYIFFQPDWRTSFGSNMEFDKAVALNKKLVNKGTGIRFLYKHRRRVWNEMWNEKIFSV